MSHPVSVLMPVYNQSRFVRCAVESLLAQDHREWELLIVDDGSTDGLEEAVADYAKADKRIRLVPGKTNRGLGHALNRGLELAAHSLIAYLPADDIYFPDHLSTLVASMESAGADMAYSGIQHTMGNDTGERGYSQSTGVIAGHTLQLVQVMHRKSAERWTERAELATDDLDRMFWTAYRAAHPRLARTGVVSCEWFAHTYQRHRIMADRSGGGIYMYKTYYGVREPIRYHSTQGDLIDEVSRYAALRDARPRATRRAGLKVLLVGELAYNPERILALEDRGCRLYGLWIKNPSNFNTVGKLPFGHVEDIPFDGWEKRVDEIKPDVIYALLNFKAVPLAHHVLTRRRGIPLVWHFKEGPFYCRSHGLWDKLVDLHEQADAVVYTNSLLQRWYSLFLRTEPRLSAVIDGDLPYGRWFTEERKPLLSESDGELHTVVAGRVFGIGSEDMETLARQHVHLHIYGGLFHKAARQMIDEAAALAPGYIHTHPNCAAADWVSEFSQYDAGWLHYYQSHNGGNLMRADWADLNSPARLSTYAMAGLPMIMHDNTGHLVHHQQYLEGLGTAVAIKDFPDLARQLADPGLAAGRRKRAWETRRLFCFDNYADELINIFRQTINNKTR